MYKDDSLINGATRGDMLFRLMGETRATPPLSARRDSKPSCDGSYGDGSPTFGLVGYPLASVYSPLQSFTDLYDVDTAHNQGTIFKELDLGFHGRRLDKGGKAL